MIDQEIQKKIISKVEKKLKTNIVDVKIPPQGMDSDVFFVKDSVGHEYAIKYSRGAMSDVAAYKLLEKNKINVAVPKFFGSFVFQNKPVVILEKIDSTLLDSIPVENMGKYIPSMIKNLKKIHQVKSDKAGSILTPSSTTTWKDIAISNFIGKNPSLDWSEVLQRDSLDKGLIQKSIDNIVKKIEKLGFIHNSYSLLHTDFNQRNLFVNTDSDEITAIIDWGEAMFGDPIFDFARVRMYIWHFNLGDEVINNYYKLMNYSKHERELDDLYWLSRVIEYLAWYSEELNEFNVGRIKLHQEFLKNYQW